MRVLIGAPIHESKNYSMEKWIKNISKIQLKYPADVILVDNSQGLNYIEKVKKYCLKHKLKNFTIKHLDIPQGPKINKNNDEQIHERIIRCEEIIRNEFLKGNYDAFFFWESDILIPSDSLTKLVNLMKTGGFEVIVHNCWVNDIPNQVNFHFGITLFKRSCLEKYSFIPDFGKDTDATSWYEAEEWYRRRLRKDNCNFLEVAGIIEPVYHLSK